VAHRRPPEGTFTQVDRTEASVGVFSGTTVETLNARLVWSPDNSGRTAPTFGDVPSAFYRPTGGEFTIETSNVNTGVAASNCATRGRETFAFARLADKLQYLSLEIAADGRYRLVLGIPDYPQTPWEMEAVCNFPGGNTVRQQVPAMLPAVTIGIQQGMLNADQAVVGEMVPQQRGPRTTTGNWSFTPAQ
jgi:hypothetical protein